MKKSLLLSAIAALTLIFFQNCDNNWSNEEYMKTLMSVGACPLNGGAIANGATIDTYSIPNSATQAACDAAKETRTCTNGILSGGSATYTSCSVITPGAGGGGPVTNLALSSNASNYNIAAAAGNPTAPVNIVLTINAGVIVSSTSAANAALSTGALPAGSTVRIVNNGSILGAGGNGGAAGSAGVNGGAGGSGGPAISLGLNVTIVNNGTIAGGGGGGGGGAGTSLFGSGGGGGGAGGSIGGAPSNGGRTAIPGATGGSGTISGAGAGGAGGSSQGVAGNSGGAGGGFGLPGGTGAADSGYTYISVGGAGGAAGAAILRNGFTASFSVAGTVLGSQL